MTDQQLMALAQDYCDRGEVPQDQDIRAVIKALFRRNDFFGGLTISGRAQHCSVEERNGRFVYTWPD
jgi:hypothetical protein